MRKWWEKNAHTLVRTSRQRAPKAETSNAYARRFSAVQVSKPSPPDAGYEVLEDGIPADDAGGHDEVKKTTSVRLKEARAYGDIPLLLSTAIIVDMFITTMQFMQFAFPEDSGWHESVKAPIIAIGSIVSVHLPRNLYFVGLYASLTLMLLAIVVFFGDAHGALVRHMEARRLAGTGITLEVDFKNKTGATMKGPVWLERCREVLVRVVFITCGLLLIPMSNNAEMVIHCEYGHEHHGRSTHEQRYRRQASDEGEDAALVVELDRGHDACTKLTDIKYWVPAWDDCVPCYEGKQMMIASITIVILAFYYVISMRLSTLTNDVSRLELLPSSGGGSVLRNHLLTSWRTDLVPAAGAFTRNPRDSWAFNLHQTAQKVVVVFLTGRLRHEPLHLSALLIAWASWVAATAVVFRPYLSSSFCRLQLVLRVLVLYSMIWSAVLLAVGTKDDTSSLVLSLSFILTVPFCTALVWRQSRVIFPWDPRQSSIARSYAHAKSLVRAMQRGFFHRGLRGLFRGGSAGPRASGERSSIDRDSRTTIVDADMHLKGRVQRNVGGGLASMFGAGSVEVVL